MRLGQVGVGVRCAVMLTALGLSVARPAHAQICFNQATAWPGLSGAPDWFTPGELRTELFDPRWLAAPRQSFESDASALQGHFRLLVDDAHSELSVSIWAPSDPDSVSAADRVYFAFTTDGTTATLAKAVSIAVPTSGNDPRAATNVQQFSYDVGAVEKWSASLASPSWLVEPAGFVEGEGADWGINFKIKLADAGLSTQQPFKLQVAAHLQNESDVPAGLDLSTPDPGTSELYSGTLLLEDPTKWPSTLALDAGCPDGVALGAIQIGTRHADGEAVVDPSPGAINHFFARPTVPAATTLFEGLFEARFFLVPCGEDAWFQAEWRELGQALPIGNGAAPAPDDATVELVCPANTATTTCGVPTPQEGEYCLAVALQQSSGQTVRFEDAVAYRELDLGLSEPGAGGAGPGGSGGESSASAGSHGAGDDGGEPGTSGGRANDPGSSGTSGEAPSSEGGAPSTGSPGPGEDDGCGCRLAGRRQGHATLALGLLLVLLRRLRHTGRRVHSTSAD